MSESLPSPRISLRATVLVLLGVCARFGLGLARFGATPARFRNFEESYNATVAWMLVHGGFVGELLTLQYRSFCGGCSIVAVAGAPLMAGEPALWRWKLLPLLWTAATQLVGFFALDAWVGRAAAWAFLLLFTVPPLGALDLSLMAWGNHQETALFAVLTLLLVAKGRGAAAGFVLGFAIWFARTAAYQALVLLPLALTLRGQRISTILGFAAGLSLLALPTAGGDAGWYRMDDAFGGDPTSLAKRAATLFAPGPLASRLWLPLRDLAPAAAVILAASAASFVWAAKHRRARVVALLPVSYAAAYCGTRFPIFLIGAKVPVNNLRYHAPWVFALTLLVAAGVGVAWAAGKRRRAAAVAGVWLAVNVAALARVSWTSDPSAWTAGAWTASALDIPQFVATATPRLSAETLAAPVGDPQAAALRARMLGLVLGHEVREGKRTPEEAVSAAERMPGAFGGLGEALVMPCESVAEAEIVLAAVPDAARAEARRGAALTMSFCESGPPSEASAPSGYGSSRGAAVLYGCGDDSPDTAALAACLVSAALTLPEPDEALFGAGRAWADPMRGPEAAEKLATLLGSHAAVFLAGAHDPAAGTHQPPFARESARPGQR